MADSYYRPTLDGRGISIMLKAPGLDYNMLPVDIGRGKPFTPEFLAISPDNRMPAIVDHDVKRGRLSIFESGAILLYLCIEVRRGKNITLTR